MTDIKKKKKKKIFRCESHKAAVVEPMQLIGLCKELISARAQVSRFHGQGLDEWRIFWMVHSSLMD